MRAFPAYTWTALMNEDVQFLQMLAIAAKGGDIDSGQ